MEPVDPAASQEADDAFAKAHANDQAFWASHPDGKLTMSPEDDQLRKEWMRLYKQALAKKTPKTAAKATCPVRRCKVVSIGLDRNTDDHPPTFGAVRFALCIPAVFKVTKFDCAPPATDDEKKCIQWFVRDAQTKVDLKVQNASAIQENGEELVINCVPFDWHDRTIEIGAQFDQPPSKAMFSGTLTLDGVLQWISLIQKAEKAHAGWTTTRMLAAMRRLSFTDNSGFRLLFGGSTRGEELVPSGPLAQGDIDQLVEWTLHDPDGKEGPPHAGVVTDALGIELTPSHVLTGITAGLTRNRSLDPTPGGGLDPFGAALDNLFAVTISGDLGQAAVFVKVGKQKKPYIGSHGEASEPELVGDIDGFLIGNSPPGSGSLSEILLQYYCPCAKNGFRKRFNSFQSTGMSNLQDQILRFGKDFIYKSEGNVTGATTKIGNECDEAFEEFKKWLAGKAAAE